MNYPPCKSQIMNEMLRLISTASHKNRPQPQSRHLTAKKRRLRLNHKLGVNDDDLFGHLCASV